MIYVGQWPQAVGEVLQGLGIVVTAVFMTQDWIRTVTACFGELGIDITIPSGPSAPPSLALGPEDAPFAALEEDDAGITEVVLEEDTSVGYGR
jgi:hypothetical protein